MAGHSPAQFLYLSFEVLSGQSLEHDHEKELGHGVSLFMIQGRFGLVVTISPRECTRLTKTVTNEDPFSFCLPYALEILHSQRQTTTRNLNRENEFRAENNVRFSQKVHHLMEKNLTLLNVALISCPSDTPFQARQHNLLIEDAQFTLRAVSASAHGLLS